MNESTFRGTINYTEAKEKIFMKSLNLSPNLLSTVKMTFKNFPTIHFKLTKEIDMMTLPKHNFSKKFPIKSLHCTYMDPVSSPPYYAKNNFSGNQTKCFSHKKRGPT